jgi:hypothetical protein
LARGDAVVASPRKKVISGNEVIQAQCVSRANGIHNVVAANAGAHTPCRSL